MQALLHIGRIIVLGLILNINKLGSLIKACIEISLNKAASYPLNFTVSNSTITLPLISIGGSDDSSQSWLL